jgi:AraC-like DNA-binding protein
VVPVLARLDHATDPVRAQVESQTAAHPRPQHFRTEGHTVAAWIRERRLQQCRRDLADPRMAAHTITAIAARWGFDSPTHFSRTFRSTYGLPPHQFRRQVATVRAVD